MMKMQETSPAIAPLLVRLYDVQRDALTGGVSLSPDMVAEVTEAAANLVAAPLETRERDLITDALLTLVQQAERDLRQAIAERLAVMDNVPIRLILKLAHDEVVVARDILRHSTALNDLDLLYIIKSQDTAYWRHIAARTRMGPLVIDALADTHDGETAKVLAENSHIHLTQHAFTVMGDMARQEVSLATPLASRADVPPELAKRLYQYVGAQLQVQLKARFRFTDTELTQIMADATTDVSDARRASGLMPSAAMLRAAFIFDSRGQLSCDVMLKTLARGQLASFVAMLAVKANVAPQAVLTMLQPDGAEGLAVTCCAIGFTKNEFMQIFILTQKVRSYDGKVSQQALHRALVYFDSLTPDRARGILAANHA